ncbi:MAG TPA: glycerol-3-phosphate 1-O-acyltransferase PlsY [Verrucomicrobiae bacterium]|nr:glycerol-3-phosphate 1-O-acyltransferase PlsY [Verrucomicrobiae bacterium]
MTSLQTVLFLAAAYFLGSLPFGLWVARQVQGIDIREHGSKNTGATNVFRVVGKKWGFFVLFLDAAKGFVAVNLPRWTLGAELSYSWLVMLGVAAILGHSFSLWLGFKGGKGVATSLGVFIGVCPVPALLAFSLWILIFSISRIISVASLAAAVVFPIAVALTCRGKPGFPALQSVSLLLTVFIFYTHRANIGRLKRGEEKRLI